MKKLLIVLLLSFTLTFGIVHAESTGENVYQKVFKLKQLFSDLYLADFNSKKINLKTYLEPIFHTFLHE